MGQQWSLASPGHGGGVGGGAGGGREDGGGCPPGPWLGPSHGAGRHQAGMALSRTSVWALALSGQVYRRTGLSSTDWLGDSWQAVSGWESDSRAVDLSVGQCDTVWTMGQCGDIRQLEVRETQVSPPLDAAGTEDTDWTIIQ